MAARNMKVWTTALSLSLALSPLAPVAQAYAAEMVDDEPVAEVTLGETDVPETDATDQRDDLDADDLVCTTEDMVAPELDSLKEEAPAEAANGERADDEQGANQRNFAVIGDMLDSGVSAKDGAQQKKDGETATPDFSTLEIKPLVKLTEGFDIKVNVTGLPAGTKPADYTVTYWFGDDEASAITEQLTSKSDNLFRVACPAATQLTVPAHVRVYYKSDVEPVQSLDYSVRDYCDSVRSDGKLSFLAVNALRYGSAAQQFFKCNTDNLASTGYNIGQPGAIFSMDDFVPDKLAAKKSGSSNKVTKVTTALQLNSKTAINFYITTTYDDPALLPIFVDGVTIEDGAEVVDRDAGTTISRRTLADGRIFVQVAGIGPKQLNHAYRLAMGLPKINVNLQGMGLIEDPYTIEFSALSYAHANQHGTADMHNLCMMLYRYYRASNQFTYYYYD